MAAPIGITPAALNSQERQLAPQGAFRHRQTPPCNPKLLISIKHGYPMGFLCYVAHLRAPAMRCRIGMPLAGLIPLSFRHLSTPWPLQPSFGPNPRPSA